MTLILLMSKAEGIYLSADYLVTDARTGETVDDSAVKHLQVDYPPAEGGSRALLAYTGLAILPDGTPMGSWIRETLRGGSEAFDDSMAHLRARLNRDVARLRIPLIINAVVLHGERRFFGGLTNMRLDDAGKLRVMRSFGYVLDELDRPRFFANGSGAAQMVAGRHRALIESQLDVEPRKVLDHMKLLAVVNRRVATTPGVRTVSPYCHVSYINADDRTSPTSRRFLEPGEDVPFDMPVLSRGLDISVLARHFFPKAQAFVRGDVDHVSPLDIDAINRALKRRP